MLKTRRGFTLLDLVFVIGIIAVFAIILFPIFTRAQEKAYQTGCMSNVKDIGLALLVYAADFNGLFPSIQGLGESPFGLLAPYINDPTRTFFCSADPLLGLPEIKVGGKMVPNSYGFRSEAFGSSVISLGRDRYPILLDSGRKVWEMKTLSDTEPFAYIAFRHNKGVNVGFHDGHGKWLRPSDLMATGSYSFCDAKLMEYGPSLPDTNPQSTETPILPSGKYTITDSGGRPVGRIIID